MADKKTTTTPAQGAPTTPAATPSVEKTPEQIIAELQEQLQAQQGIISGQAEQLKAAEAQGVEGRTVVTHEGQLFRVVAKQFSVGDGDPIQAEELKNKPELVKKLVDAKSGVLVAITKEEASAE